MVPDPECMKAGVESKLKSLEVVGSECLVSCWVRQLLRSRVRPNRMRGEDHV